METSLEKEREELRNKNQLRALSDEEEGLGINRQPNGVFGFTYSPAEENFPLFKKKTLRCYEAHKLADGSGVLVGFVTQGESLKLDTGRESVSVHLFPDPVDESVALMSIPMARVLSHKQLSQRGGKGLELEVGPVS